MKHLLISILTLSSLSAFAKNLSYDCKSKRANDVGLPTSIYVQIEGLSISIQNDDNDLYYSGQFTSSSSRQATGFKNLIIDGHVLVSKAMMNNKTSASLTIFDEALDSVITKYSCTKL